MCKRGDDDSDLTMSLFGKKNRKNQAPGDPKKDKTF